MADNNPKRNDRIRTFDVRLLFFKALYTLFALALAGYLFAGRVVDVKQYSKKAKARRTSEKFVMRGSILDRNGVKLASDQLSYNVYFHKQYQDNTPEELAKRLSKYLNMSEASLIKIMNSPNSIIPLKKDMDRKTPEEI